MRRSFSLALLLAALLIPTLLHADGPAAPGIEVAAPAAAEAGPSCNPGALTVAAVFAQAVQPTMTSLPDVRLASGGNPYCDQNYCPWAHPVFACQCACDAEACYCADACAETDFRCLQRCRDAQNNCYVCCQGL